MKYKTTVASLEMIAKQYFHLEISILYLLEKKEK